MKVLLTGASGFLGGHIFRELQRQGHEVTVLGRSDVAGSAGFVRFDLNGGMPDDVDGVLPAIELIIHCAGLAHVDSSEEAGAHRMREVNWRGAERLTAFLDLASCSADLVYVSTVSVYGQRSGVDVGEDDATEPGDAYGRSKLMAERHLRAWCQAEGRHCLVIRPPLVLGTPPVGNLAIMVAAIQRRRFAVFGDGGSRRSWIGVRDLARFAIVAGGADGIYNVTSTRDATVAEIADAVCAELQLHPVPRVPYRLGRLLAAVGDRLRTHARVGFPLDSERFDRLTSTLTFTGERAVAAFDWRPEESLASALDGLRSGARAAPSLTGPPAT